MYRYKPAYMHANKPPKNVLKIRNLSYLKAIEPMETLELRTTENSKVEMFYGNNACLFAKTVMTVES